MEGYVQQQAPPGEPRLIADRQTGKIITGVIVAYQLQEGVQSEDGAQVRCCIQPYPGGADLQVVAFILIQGQLSRPVNDDHQGGGQRSILRADSPLPVKKNTCLPAEAPDKPAGLRIQAFVRMAGDGDPEGFRDSQARAAGL